MAGESGVGKTRLLSELERAARADGVRVIGGECVELGEGELPYAPIVGALRPLARAGDPAFAALSPAARAALAQILPGLGRGDGDADDEATAQARLFDALLELLELLAGEDGLLVTIEDLHWADRSTRAFLVYLASSLCRERVLVVTTYRPDELHRRHPLRPLLAELERDARARRVELHRLTRAELAEQLADILGSEPRDGPAGPAVRALGGQSAVRGGAAGGRDGRPRRAAADAARRADAADRAAVGRRAGAAAAARRRAPARSRRSSPTRRDADSRVLREALREAVAAQLVVPDEEGFYAFRHALLREVVVDDLLPGERAELHLALARALERRAEGLPDHGGAHLAAGIAYHYLESGDQPAALAAAVRAAEAAAVVHANGEAAALYSRALKLWDRVAGAEELTGLDHVELLRAAAWATFREHDPARAETLLRAALAEVERSGAPRRGCSRCSRGAQFDQGRSADAAETRHGALDLLPDEPSETRAMLLASLTKDLMMESRYREAVDAAKVALEVAQAAGDEISQIRALDAMGVSLFGLARFDEGERALREALRRSEEGGHLHMLQSHLNLAESLAEAGRLAEAREIADEGFAKLSERGYPRRWLALMRSELAFEAGDWAEAERLLPSPGRPTMGMTFVNEALRRIELALGRGDHELARTILDQAC